MIGSYSSLFLRRGFTVPTGQKPTSLVVHARVDDGCIIWINGTEVARFHVSSTLSPKYNSLAIDHEADPSAFESVTVTGADKYLVEGANVVAVQAFNSSLNSSDFTIDVWVEAAPAAVSTSPTPGAVNSCYSATPPPAIRQVNNLPVQPSAGQPVLVTAKVTDPTGVSAVALSYQTVDPGAYVTKTDAAYATGWTSVPMYDDGTNGDRDRRRRHLFRKPFRLPCRRTGASCVIASLPRTQAGTWFKFHTQTTPARTLLISFTTGRQRGLAPLTPARLPPSPFPVRCRTCFPPTS